MRREQLILILLLLVGASLLILAAKPMVPYQGRFPANVNRLSFGSSQTGDTGWLMPANTVISTSYVANQSLSSFIGAALNVYPYEIQSGTALDLGLYVKAKLVATQNYVLTGIYKTPATILRNAGSGLAEFSNSTVGYTVALLHLTSSFPAGTKVTVTAWASNPVWIQVDTPPLSRSYELTSSLQYTPPEIIAPEAGSIAPYALSIGLESS